MESDKLSSKSSRSSESCSLRLSQDFHGYELLLLRRLQSDPNLCCEWGEKLQKKIQDDDYDIGEIPYSLWYLTVTLDRKKQRFLNFVREQIGQAKEYRVPRSRDTLLTSYLNSHLFTELHLDGIFKYGDDNTLPVEIFKCPSVRWLSLKYNYLDRIPPDIGRMANLECLSLTNNKLQNKSIPYTLTFCACLKHLLLDNNLLDALPGYLLKMPKLETVHRHGNHNYFKSTFMWYHTDVNERILAISGSNDFMPREPESLQFWAAKAVIGSKINFFTDQSVAPMLKDYISEIYNLFNVCGCCNTAKLCNQSGFKVITFKNPYLGNTCVPFQHWACSLSCAMAIEIPAREEQIAAARELDKQYDSYIRECQRQYHVSYASYQRLSIRRRSRRWRSSATASTPTPPALLFMEEQGEGGADEGEEGAEPQGAMGGAGLQVGGVPWEPSTPSPPPSLASSTSQLSTSCLGFKHRSCHCTIS